jgi:type IV fimbrial biogenesis protein FimT
MGARGFTLIELVVAMTIFALLVMLAGPGYSEFISNSHIRNASEAMLNGFRLAQAQAVKSNLPTVFTLGASGWTVTTDDPDNPGTPMFKESYSTTEGAKQATVTATPAGANQITFGGMGRIIPNDDKSATITRVDVTNSKYAGSRALRVIANDGSAAGTKICDPAMPSTEPQGCP